MEKNLIMKTKIIIKKVENTSKLFKNFTKFVVVNWNDKKVQKKIDELKQEIERIDAKN